MALAYIGFAISIIAETRILTSGITTRIDDIRNAPDAFHSLTEKLRRLISHIERVEILLQTIPVAIPDEVAAFVKETLEYVRRTVTESGEIVDIHVSKAFPKAPVHLMVKLKCKFYRMFRATAIISSMNDLQLPLQEASFQLSALTSMLAAARLNIQAHQDIFVAKLDGLEVTRNVEEVHNEAAGTPTLPQSTHL